MLPRKYLKTYNKRLPLLFQSVLPNPLHHLQRNVLVQCLNSRDENFSSIRQIFRRTFLNSWFTLHFVTLMGAKFGVYQELRKVDLKLTLNNGIIWRKIVVSRLETLHVDHFFFFSNKGKVLNSKWESGFTFKVFTNLLDKLLWPQCQPSS